MHHLKRFMVSWRTPRCNWYLINHCAQVLMIQLLVWVIVSLLLLMIRLMEHTWIIGNLSLISMINRWRLNGAVSSISQCCQLWEADWDVFARRGPSLRLLKSLRQVKLTHIRLHCLVEQVAELMGLWCLLVSERDWVVHLVTVFVN